MRSIAQHLCFLLFLVLESTGLTAAASPSLQYADRGALASGLWYNPSRSGEGFEFRAIRDEVFAVWFTYNEDGSAVWYTAQGNLRTGLNTPMPLLFFRLVDGQPTAPTRVGSLTLDVKSQGSIVADFELHGARGQSRLLPLISASNAPEIDHSGQWYLPGRAGFGLGLQESEGVGIASYFIYDASGQPVWFFGARNGAKESPYEMQRYHGACPSCPYRAPVIEPAGSLHLKFPTPDQLTIRSTGRFASPYLLQDVALTRLTAGPRALAASRNLVSFANIEEFERDARERLRLLASFPPPNFGGINFAAGGNTGSTPAAPPVSSANRLDAAIDEAISLRAEGELVYALDSRDASLRVGRYQAGSIVPMIAKPLSKGLGFSGVSTAGSSVISGANTGLLFGEDKLVVARRVRHGNGYPYAAGLMPGQQIYFGTLVDIYPAIVGPGAPQTLELEGDLISVRRRGSIVTLVTNTFLRGPNPSAAGSTLLEMQGLIQQHSIVNMLPRVRINGGNASALLSPDRIYVPPSADSRAAASLMLITEFDLRRPMSTENLRTVAVYGVSGSFLFTENSLYLTSTGVGPVNAASANITPQSSINTTVHRFATGAEGITYQASGTVPGSIQRNSDAGSLRMAERGEQLMILTELRPELANGLGINRLTILERSLASPYLLKTKSQLPNLSRPAPIGKPSEQLFGSRFIGDRLYATTFRTVALQPIDPLYVIDIANGADPKILGELEFPGLSDYLHPLPNNMLFGIGRIDGSAPLSSVMQLSLFDVSNPSAPKRTDVLDYDITGGGSALLRSHLALSSIITGGQADLVFPAAIYATPDGIASNFVGLLQLKVSTTSGRFLVPTFLSSPSFGAVQRDAVLAATQDGRTVRIQGLQLYLESGRLWQFSEGASTLVW